MTLFDPDEGARRRDEAMGRADDHADRSWKALALEAIRECALRAAEFTTDDVWLLLDDSGESTHERRAMGPLMVKAAKRGWIRATDRTRKSDRPVCHRNPKAVWASLICGGAA